MDNDSAYVPIPFNNEGELRHQNALYTLSLQAQHNMSDTSVNKIVSCTIMNRLSGDGIQMRVSETFHKIQGALVFVPADILAANWLGQFKEGTLDQENKGNPSICYAKKGFETSNAAKKLEIACDVSSLVVVFENDGTLIDEDEIILELGKESLMILTPSQIWTAARKDEMDEPAPQNERAEPAKGIRCFGQHQLDNDQDTCTAVELELPHFSPLVLQQLRDNNIELVWNKFVGEAANIIFQETPRIMWHTRATKATKMERKSYDRLKSVSDLLTAMETYQKHLKDQLHRVEKKHRSCEPVRSIDNNWGLQVIEGMCSEV
ncbi:hypothetical protein MAR_029174 [Mya arenaria]|uniref:CIDE-N domain-containing protein n=1 Tax=Mya arenaria TaxID=6604 RepID=A0ABY7DJ25_MYAAR|nr:hypothetical protein MAR_029174 [Mya arenaria]